MKVWRKLNVELTRNLGGGAMGSRTPDLLIANETLYQLSYDPEPNSPKAYPKIPLLQGENGATEKPTGNQFCERAACRVTMGT